MKWNCRVVDVSENGFHAWHTRPPCERAQKNARLVIEILAVHHRAREICGVKRLYNELVDQGVQITAYRVRALRNKLNLHCKQKRKFKLILNIIHRSLLIFWNESLLLAHLAKRGSAISPIFLQTKAGCILSGIKELFNGELIGYAMNERMTTDLIIQALFRATDRKLPEKGLVLHSDRGSQYCAHDYQDRLKQLGIVSSMSGKGDCWDNAPMESFRGTLENELVHHRKFKTRLQAKQEITEYIEIFYNRQRKQEKLDYLSPAEFTQRYDANILVA
ncbi:putative transposase [Nitrosomonas sp. Nm34]|nr:putative transposase [Nitrosomonas sp. Nm34]